MRGLRLGRDAREDIFDLPAKVQLDLTAVIVIENEQRRAIGVPGGLCGPCDLGQFAMGDLVMADKG